MKEMEDLIKRLGCNSNNYCFCLFLKFFLPTMASRDSHLLITALINFSSKLVGLRRKVHFSGTIVPLVSICHCKRSSSAPNAGYCFKNPGSLKETMLVLPSRIIKIKTNNCSPCTEGYSNACFPKIHFQRFFGNIFYI